MKYLFFFLVFSFQFVNGQNFGPIDYNFGYFTNSRQVIKTVMIKDTSNLLGISSRESVCDEEDGKYFEIVKGDNILTLRNLVNPSRSQTFNIMWNGQGYTDNNKTLWLRCYGNHSYEEGLPDSTYRTEYGFKIYPGKNEFDMFVYDNRFWARMGADTSAKRVYYHYKFILKP